MPMTGSPQLKVMARVMSCVPLLTRSAQLDQSGEACSLTSMPTLRSWLLRYSATIFCCSGRPGSKSRVSAKRTPSLPGL